MKKLFIKTYGCQMNVYDSTRMADLLAPIGYAPTEDSGDADMVILNTCHIREKAAEKIYSELGRLKKLKDARRETGSNLTIAVAGCVAQAEGEEIIARQPAVDMVLGPQSYHRLPEMIAKIARDGGRALETDFSAVEKFDALPVNDNRGAVTAFLTVQEGCDKFCTFCVVPYTRGAEMSRSAADIVREAKNLVATGAREITLLGQNVNAFRDEDGVTLAGLLYRLSEIPGLARLRYTTSHPRDMGDDLIEAHRDLATLMPYLHLPVQSGSDRILKAMNRQHTAQEYLALIERIRGARGDMALSSDFIVGFPGESDKDFEATMKLVRDVKFASAFSFKYSPRPGTPASAAKIQVPEDVKSARLETLQACLREQMEDFNASCVGRTLPVLIEKPGRQTGQAIGRSPYLQSVTVENAAHLIGEMRDVRITEVQPNSLKGETLEAVAV